MEEGERIHILTGREPAVKKDERVRLFVDAASCLDPRVHP
jgi:hypothetical protein